MPSPVKIDVVSDVVCPWCYLGKHRLERAIAKAGVPVTVEWHPYQLDPTIPPGGLPRDAYMRQKFGDLSRLEGAHQRLVELGKAVGIHYAFDKQKVSANTLDAHRLVLWAGEVGRQTEMVERLFQLNFIEGADVGAHDVLAEAAAAEGLDEAEIRARLAGDEGKDTVRAEIAMWQRAGVTGVPCFVLNRRYAVMGAQEIDVLADAILSAAEDAQQKTATA